MKIPAQLFPAVIGEELRAQLWKDIVSDFSGQIRATTTTAKRIRANAGGW
jgi:hypothetical protein